MALVRDGKEHVELVRFGVPGDVVVQAAQVRGHFGTSIISWPHLVERFELLIIITFGEGIVGMTGFFATSELTVAPFLVFGELLFQFGSYVVQIHNLVEHRAQQRGLRLMFSHYFIVIAVNLMAVALKAAGEEGFDGWFICWMMVASLVLFYVALMANTAYYKEGVEFMRRDAALMAAAVSIGCALVLVSGGETFLYLLGALVVAVLNFTHFYYLQFAME